MRTIGRYELPHNDILARISSRVYPTSDKPFKNFFCWGSMDNPFKPPLMVAGGNKNCIIYGVVPRLTFEWSGGPSGVQPLLTPWLYERKQPCIRKTELRPQQDFGMTWCSGVDIHFDRSRPTADYYYIVR